MHWPPKKDELAFYADRSTDSAFGTRNGHVSNMRRKPFQHGYLEIGRSKDASQLATLLNWSALESLVAAPPPSNRVVGSIFPYHRLAFGVAGGFWFRARHSRNHRPRSSGAFRLGIGRRN
jgi:hypothetical protein